MVMDDLFSGSSAVLLYFFAALGGGLKPRLDEKARPIDRVLECSENGASVPASAASWPPSTTTSCTTSALSRSQAQFESGKAFWRA
jgi:hypothetical protein